VLEIQSVFSAFGLSASAGLNAYIPLLMVAVVARLWPDVIRLSQPFDMLTSWWAIAILVALVCIEVLADKVPLIDHANDLIGTIVRPVSGAILFAASTGSVEFIDPRLGFALGFFVAGTTHAAKATARPLVTASTGGMGNPVVSTIEDVTAFFTSLFAILAPIILGFALVAFGFLLLWWMTRRQRARRTEIQV
jgi:hypothetical protein